MSHIDVPELTRSRATDTSEPQHKRPPLYRVVMLNDDFTPMDFVVMLLMRFFHKSEEQAQALMLQVHQQGRAVCGVFPKDIAETKVQQVAMVSRSDGHPLRCMIERDGDD